MSNQEKVLRSMAERVYSFYPGSFGITEFSDIGSIALLTERCVYPIAHMSLYIADQSGTVLICGAELPHGCRLLLDDHGEDPAYARLALTWGASDIIAISGDTSPIQGSVLVITDVEGSEQSAIAISAVFGIEDNRQVSSILWDTSSELITHWVLQDKLLEKGVSSYGHSLQSNEFGSLLQYNPEQ